MLRFIKQKYTDFLENRKLNKEGINQLADEIASKVLAGGGFIKIKSHSNDKVYVWHAEIIKGKCVILPEDKKFEKKVKFESFLATQIRYEGVLAIIFRNFTNQFIETTEITELWGYRLALVDHLVKLQAIKVKDLYDSVMEDENNSSVESTVFCGPDGKIIGWDADEIK